MVLDVYTSLMLIRPLPPCVLCAYHRPTSLLTCKLPDIAITFLVLMSKLSISFLVESSILTVGLIIGIAKTLCDVTLFTADS